MFKSTLVTIKWYDSLVDLFILDMIDFVMILGMDWLFSHHSFMD